MVTQVIAVLEKAKPASLISEMKLEEVRGMIAVHIAYLILYVSIINKNAYSYALFIRRDAKCFVWNPFCMFYTQF